MNRRCVRSTIFFCVWLAACDPDPGSQVSPVEGEVELASVTHAPAEPAESASRPSSPRHAVEAWALVVDRRAERGPREIFGMVTASGALDGTFGLRFGLPEEAGFEREPIGAEEPARFVEAVRASRECARWRRDACLSVGGTPTEGITFRARVDEGELPVERVEVVDADRDPLEGIAVPLEGRLVAVRIERKDPAFSEPVVLVRYLDANRVLVGVVEPPFDDDPRTMVLGESREAILAYARSAFDRFEMSRGVHRGFERALRRELLGLARSERVPEGQWQAYYVLSSRESAALLPIGIEPGTHAMRRVTLVRAAVEDARVADVIY